MTFCGPFDSAVRREISLSLGHSVSCVIDRIGFVFRAVVGNALDDEFGIVTPRQGAFCIGPIVLGLAQDGALSHWFASNLLVVVPTSVLRIDLELEIAEVVSLR